MPREAKETPYEFERRLRSERSEELPEMGAITEAYVRARYGGVQLSDADVKRLREEWERLRATMEE